MQNNTLKILLLFCVVTAAIAAGYKFLRIDVDLSPTQGQEIDVEPVVTVQTLDVVEPSPPQAAAPRLDPPVTRDDIKEKIVKKLRAKGADVLDSRVFDDKNLCNEAVKVVIGEYRKRGIQERDTAETAPFDGSTGSVWMLRNGQNIYYVGCITPDHIDWAVYVHFVPGVKPVSQP